MTQLANAVLILAFAVMFHGCMTSGRGAMNPWPKTQESAQ